LGLGGGLGVDWQDSWHSVSGLFCLPSGFVRADAALKNLRLETPQRQPATEILPSDSLGLRREWAGHYAFGNFKG
jgi:hypothetical protein